MRYQTTFRAVRGKDEAMNRNLAGIEDQFKRLSNTINEQDIMAKKPWVDVRAYGAKGDGITDDTAAFQAAISSLGTSSGTIIFPNNMKLTDTISLPDLGNYQSILIKGCEPFSKIIFTHTSHNVFNFPLTGAYKVVKYVFEDMFLYGPGAVSGNGIDIDGTGWHVIMNLRNVRVIDFGGGIGICGKGIYNSTLENVRSESNSIGIKWMNSANADLFYNVYALYNKTYGVYIDDITTFGWYGGDIEENLENGLYINGLHNGVFSQVHFERNNYNEVAGKYAIYLESTNGKNNFGITFISCRFTEPTKNSQIYMKGIAGFINSGIVFLNCEHRGWGPNNIILDGIYNQGIEFLGGQIDPNNILNESNCPIFHRNFTSSTGKFDFPSFIGNMKWTCQTTQPTSGKFKRGDLVWNSAPVAGGTMGWACIDRTDTTIRVQANPPDVLIEVNSTAGLSYGTNNVIGIVLDDSSIHWTYIVAITDADTLQIAVGIPAGRYAPVNANVYVIRWKAMPNLVA